MNEIRIESEVFLEVELNEQLKFLIGLQKIDSSIRFIADIIESLPHKLEKYRASLKETNASFQRIKKKYEELNKKKKERDLELEECQEKINKLKSRSREIKTNKEYEAHLREIEAFEKNKYKIEDEILSLMEGIESFSKELQKKDEKVKKAEEDFRQHEKVLEEEKKRLDQELETYKTKRKDFVARIDEGIYEQYMNLLKRWRGSAVAPTENEVCLGCNTNIPPQLYNDIKKSEGIFSCSYCKRFLYYQTKPCPAGEIENK